MKPALLENDVRLADPEPEEALRAAAANNPAVLNLPVSIAISVGRARLTVAQLLALDASALITLDARIDDPVELLIDGRTIARGALVEIEGDPGAIGVRITEAAGNRGG